MTPEQMRIAIAEACGWTDIAYRPIEGGWSGKTKLCVERSADYYIALPNYPNCLNAMHEAEKVLTDEQSIQYYTELYNVVERDYDRTTPSIHSANFDECGRCWRTFKCIHATSQQRAEAFLRTIDKWKD